MLILTSYATHARAVDPKGHETPSSTTLGKIVDPLVRGAQKINSSASCAATACHGGPRSGVSNEFASRGSEYPLWLERDPHARSWRTICGEKSLAIMQRLNIIQGDGQISDKLAFDNCLACHNTTGELTNARTTTPTAQTAASGTSAGPYNSEMIREGVGCNSCHGPSELWKSTHYQSSWQATRKLESGFVPASEMLARARMCASCHVGDRNRDMNHDIIAAGHPALYYEFSTYHQRLPKHWRDSQSSDPQRYESSQWLAGQIAALDASLTLLEARASKTLSTSRWPDFASYECSSCHQQLRPGSLDYSSNRSPSGVAKLSRWNRFGVQAWLDGGQSADSFSAADQRLLESLAELERVSHLSPEISAEVVSVASKSVRLQLDRWLNSSDSGIEINRSAIGNISARRLRDTLIQAGSRPETFANWESATQFYLASVAARAAWPDGVQGSALTTARELRAVLTFEPGTSQNQSTVWHATSGFKSVPIKAGIQHWNALSSTPVN